MRPIITTLTTLIVFALLAILVRYFIVTVGVRGAAVITLASPGNKYLAWVDILSQKYFWGGHRDYYEFYVLPHEVHADDPNFPWAHEPRHLVVCDVMNWTPPSTRVDGWCDIMWMPDSSAVTFDLHGASISLSTHDL